MVKRLTHFTFGDFTHNHSDDYTSYSAINTSQLSMLLNYNFQLIYLVAAK